MRNVNVDTIFAIGYFIVHPIWDKGITQSGILTGEQYYDESENPPGWFNPTSGIVISAPPRSNVKKGDKLFFTWNAFDFKNCISHRNDQNIYAIGKHGIYAYERDGRIHGTEYILSERLFQEDEEQVTESGIILSGLRAVGSFFNPDIVKKQEIMKQYGKIKYLPDDMPFEYLLNPYSGVNEKLEPGKVVLVDDTSDLPVLINGETLYRTRFWEVIHVCDYNQLKVYA